MGASQPRALAVGPALKLLRIREMESIEERSVVNTDGRFGVVTLDRSLELPKIAGDAGGVQAEVIAGAEHRVVAQGCAKDVERVAKEMPGVVGTALRPERRDQSVTAKGAGMLDCKKGQQRDALTQGGPAGYRGVRTVE
jgi:hypothetical protein